MAVLAFVIGIAVIVVGLALSIALHEIGHLVPAKLFRVRVGQYMIGFGPTLWSKRIGETEYGVKALPLGGFISMAGMYPPAHATAAKPGRAGGGFFATMVQDARDANAETLTGTDDARTFYRLPIWQRVIVMLGGPLMNLLLAIVLFTIVFSGFGVAQASTTLASVSACVRSAAETTASTACAASDPVAPAAAAGLLPGDTIVSIDGTAVSTFADVSAIVSAAPGQPLQFLIDRDGQQQTRTVTPLLTERAAVDERGHAIVGADGNPTTVEVGFIGVGAAIEQVRQPLWTGAEQAFSNVGAVTGIIVQLPAKLTDVAVSLFTGAERDPNGPISVVGVGVIAGEVAAADSPVESRISAMLSLVASLNIALFVFNLVPLLPLDGGHVAIALWDGVRRWWAKLRGKPEPRPTDATKLVPITFVVVVLLIGMTALLLAADVFNPIRLFQ